MRYPQSPFLSLLRLSVTSVIATLSPSLLFIHCYSPTVTATPPPSLRAKRSNPSFDQLLERNTCVLNKGSKDGLLRFARNDGGGVAVTVGE